MCRLEIVMGVICLLRTSSQKVSGQGLAKTMHSCTGLKRAHGTPIDNICRRLEKSTKPLDIKINYEDHINREKYEYLDL